MSTFLPLVHTLHHLQISRRRHAAVLHRNLATATPQRELHVDGVTVTAHARAGAVTGRDNRHMLLLLCHRDLRAIALDLCQSGVVRGRARDALHRHARRLTGRRPALAVTATRRPPDADHIVAGEASDTGTL